ncbi:MAG: acetate--CoA ligase family protein, partial [Proteobacteria bacterium]|nr:acetate--CoA ligase family protein [Pseudomonadota bacterium]
MINKIVAVLMEEPLVDSIYITGFFGGFKEIIAPHVGELEEKTSQALVDLVKQYQKPLVVHTSFANEPFRSMKILHENDIFVTPSSERAAQCLSYLSHFSVNRDKLKKASLVKTTKVDADTARETLRKVKEAGRDNLLETEARELLALYGIKLPRALLATTKDEAVKAAKEIGSPMAMKI